jgi:hypothetical protein
MSSRTLTPREKEAAAAVVELAIQGGLIRHTERQIYLAAAANNPRAFVAHLEKKEPAPSVEVQLQEAAQVIVVESRGKTSFAAAVQEAGRRFPSLLTAYAREHHHGGRAS